MLLSTIKPSEAGNDFVIRLYNPTDTPATCTLEYDNSLLDSLFSVSLSENDKKSLENTFTLKPFEIYTILAMRKQ